MRPWNILNTLLPKGYLTVERQLTTTEKAWKTLYFQGFCVESPVRFGKRGEPCKSSQTSDCFYFKRYLTKYLIRFAIPKRQSFYFIHLPQIYGLPTGFPLRIFWKIKKQTLVSLFSECLSFFKLCAIIYKNFVT